MAFVKTEEPEYVVSVKTEELDPAEALASGIERNEQPAALETPRPTNGEQTNERPARKRRRRARLNRKPKHPQADIWGLLSSERPRYISEGQKLVYTFESMDGDGRRAIMRIIFRDIEDAREKKAARLEAKRIAWQERNRMRRDGIELVRLGPEDEQAIYTRTRGKQRDSYPNTRARAAQPNGRAQRVARRGGMQAIISAPKGKTSESR
ncbi:hypothetical protein FRC12_014466 [Ceratobasidium sp. 428]|nr:hypothetical protein FRC12_014466 [Ceratobasidium sp. 428]